MDLGRTITAAGGTSTAIEVDITDTAVVTEAVGRVASEAGRIDTLVNDAGVMLLGPAADAPWDEWQRMVDLNVTALMATTHAALPHLLAATADAVHYIVTRPRRVAVNELLLRPTEQV